MKKLMTIFSMMTLLVLGSAVQTVAGGHGSINFEDATKRAEAVFHGRVVDIEYANSEADGVGESLPHTFVTFEVKRVFKGRISSKELTLRFLGGYDPETDTILYTSISPRFDIGDEDILFVARNTESICPLIDCNRSRLRVIQDAIYSEDGHEILMTGDGEFASGRIADLDETTSHTIHDRTFHKISDEKSGPGAGAANQVFFSQHAAMDRPEMGGVKAKEEAAWEMTAVEAKLFEIELTRIIRQSHSTLELGRLQPVANAFIDDAFESNIPQVTD